MKLLRAAAKAAGQVGTLYAENLIREDVLAKRDERLRAANVEDREARYAHDEAMFDKRTAHQTALADKQWERDQELAREQREYEEGRITKTAQIGDSYYGFTAGGEPREITELSEAVKSANTTAAKQKAAEQIHDLRVKLMDKLGSVPEDEFNKEKEALDQMERELYMTPEQKKEETTQREVAEIASKRDQAIQLGKLAQENGKTLEQQVEFYNQQGNPIMAKAIAKYWPEATGTAPKPGTPEYAEKPVEERAAIAEDIQKKKQAEQEQEEKLKQNVPWMKQMARHHLANNPISPEALASVEASLDKIRSVASLGLFTTKEIKRFNAAIREINKLPKYGGAPVHHEIRLPASAP